MKAWLLSIISELIITWLRKRIPQLQAKVDKAQAKLEKKVAQLEETPIDEWNFK